MAHSPLDELALATPEADAFCSSTAWALSAHETFHPEQEPYFFESELGYLVLARGWTPAFGRYLCPLEAMWGLASPLVGRQPLELGRQAGELLLSLKEEWDGLWLCGLSPRSHAFVGLAMALGEAHNLYMGPTTRRHVSSLVGGLDGFLERRSSSFRRNLRRAERGASAAGVVFRWERDFVDESARRAAYGQALDVDDRSWKGLSDQGLNASGMAEFYDRMTSRLAREGRLRMVFGELDGEVVAMGFGGLLGDTFRGLQMSYDDRFKSLSLGNLVQWEMVQRLAQEDTGVLHYDLGTDIGYKARWSEPGLETVALVVRPS